MKSQQKAAKQQLNKRWVKADEMEIDVNQILQFGWTMWHALLVSNIAALVWFFKYVFNRINATHDRCAAHDSQLAVLESKIERLRKELDECNCQ